MPADDARAVGKSVRMFVASGTQQQKSRVYGSACDNDDIGRVPLLDAVVIDKDGAYAAAGRVGFKTLDERIGDERDVLVFERRLDADDLCIGLAVDQARIAVESIAADAGTGVVRLTVLLVKQHAER